MTELIAQILTTLAILLLIAAIGATLRQIGRWAGIRGPDEDDE